MFLFFTTMIGTKGLLKVTSSLVHSKHGTRLSQKWCKSETLLQTTNMKWHMAHRIVAIPTTLCDLQGQ